MLVETITCVVEGGALPFPSTRSGPASGSNHSPLSLLSSVSLGWTPAGPIKPPNQPQTPHNNEVDTKWNNSNTDNQPHSTNSHKGEWGGGEP